VFRREKMTGIPGYAGQILEINLTSGTTRNVPLDPQLARDYIGGRALGVKLLWDEYGGNWKGVDPLGPDSVLLLMGGPTNSYAPGKTISIFKSPMSGGAMGSAMSGDWPAMIRCAGYDGLMIKGKADSPVWLYIDNDHVEFRDARGLWGMDTRETHKALMMATDPKLPMLYIGPAGENQTKFAVMMTNWYKACGRGGSGAVMGSKNLKGLVVRGTGPAPEPADAKGLLDLLAELQKAVPAKLPSRHLYGTVPGIYTQGAQNSSGPFKNWQDEYHDWPNTQAAFYSDTDWKRRYWADYGCTLACCKMGRILNGPHAGTVFELPDYEAGAYCGANFDVSDIQEIAYLADLFDKWGLDVISGANVLGWAAELHQRSILTTGDLDGVDLKWSDGEAFAKMVPKLALREGIGDTLAESTYAAAKKIGHDTLQYAVQVKGIELGAHGVRSGQDYTKDPISYAICTQGGDHTTIANKTGEMWYLEDTWPICGFWSGGVTSEQKLQLLNACTGYGVTQDELDTVLIPRWVSLQRAIQLLAGWTHEDDHNPPRFYEPLPSGPYKGKKVDRDEEQKLIQEAFAARGWDSRGVPTSETLKKLGLADVDSALASCR
jgi:aldehyde:ferredoxin oxidoreductase